jgi:hypothetical protein
MGVWISLSVLVVLVLVVLIAIIPRLKADPASAYNTPGGPTRDGTGLNAPENPEGDSQDPTGVSEAEGGVDVEPPPDEPTVSYFDLKNGDSR